MIVRKAMMALALAGMLAGMAHAQPQDDVCTRRATEIRDFARLRDQGVARNAALRAALDAHRRGGPNVTSDTTLGVILLIIEVWASPSSGEQLVQSWLRFCREQPR